jgi:hypothetical protein
VPLVQENGRISSYQRPQERFAVYDASTARRSVELPFVKAADAASLIGDRASLLWKWQGPLSELPTLVANGQNCGFGFHVFSCCVAGAGQRTRIARLEKQITCSRKRSDHVPPTSLFPNVEQLSCNGLESARSKATSDSVL